MSNNDDNGMDVDGNGNGNDQNDNNKDNIQETDKQKEERALKLKAAGNKKYGSKNYTEAIQLYTDAINTFKRVEFYGNRAAAYIAINDFENGLKDCLDAINIDNNFRKAYIRGTKCYTELGQFDDAKKLANAGIEKFPNDNQLKQGYDRVCIIENKLDRINSKLNSVSQKYNSMYEKQLNNNNNNDMDIDEKDNNKKKLLHKLLATDLREVNIAFSMISSLLNNDLSLSLNLKCIRIRCLIIQQNYDLALSSATNLLRWNKDNILITKLRAIALFRTGNIDSSRKHLQNILRKDPDNKSCKILFKLFKNIGRCKEAGNKAFKSLNYDLAISKYTECLIMDQTNLKFNAVIYANRAAVYLKKKLYQNVYDDCTVSIELDSSYIKSYCRRVQALIGLERYDEAVGDAEKALKLNPTSSELRQQLREAKIELKKSKRKNYYKILGVDKDATEKEIKKGFRKKAMQWHPDKFATEPPAEQKKAEEMFKEIGEAYEVLKDPKMKKRYDNGADLDEIKQGSHFGMGGGVDISHIFDLLGGMGGGHPFAGMGGGGGGGMPHGFHQSGSNGNGQTFTFRFG